MIKRIFRVTDMHCTNCAMRIEEIEDDLPGVRHVSASYRKMQVTVEYDESKVNEAQLIEAVKKKGYTALPSATS
jgi:copper chaperone CopZ